MVGIIKRKKGNRNFYYLKHTSATRQREVYLGREIPDNINVLKENFMFEFYRQEWIPKLENISKRYCSELKRTPKKVRDNNLDNFCIHFTYNTQRIEGSTMTFRETADLLMHDVPPLKRPDHERHEAKMHKKIFLQMVQHKQKITLKTILRWHEEIFSLTDHVNAGMIRKYPAGVSGSKVEFPMWEDVPEDLEQFFKWYNKNKITLNPAELAIMAHYKFVSIHPFGDGNGRISKLIMNYILHENDYPMFIVKTADRRSYARSLERSNLKNNAIFFVQWFMKRYIRANSQYLKESRQG